MPIVSKIKTVDLDKNIPYHTITDANERQLIWDYRIHLKPAGYDRMVLLIFQTIKLRLLKSK